MSSGHSTRRPARSGFSRLRVLAGLIVAAALTVGAPSRGADAPAPAPVKPAAGSTAPAQGTAADGAAGSAPTAAALSPLDGPAPVEVTLKSRDGHTFAGLYAAPSSSTSNAILIVPDLGQRRDHFLGLAKDLRARGYRVLSMDNTGQLRHVARGPNAMPIFKPMTTQNLGVLVQDVGSGIAGLRAQPGVGQVAVLGFGIGANAALLAAGADATVAGVGAVLPNYGCEEFNPYAAFGDMNTRPVLLLESRKKYNSDLSVAFEAIKAKRKDLSYEHVKLRRDPDALTQQELEEDYEESLLAWLEKAFPTASH